METPSVENVFARAWSLLTGNWAIVVPGIAIGLVSGIVIGLLTPVSTNPSPAGDLLSRLLIMIVQVVAAILTISYTTGMADAAWKTGRATFADGRRAFERDGANVLIAMGGLFAAGLAASFLAPFTLFLSLVAYVYFCIYTMASAVVGERRGIAAIVESAEMAYARVVPTTLMVAAIVGLVFGMSLLTLLLYGIPVIGSLVSALSVQALIAYLTLVIVGEYIALQGNRAGTRS